MTLFLVDTSALSAFAPDRPRPAVHLQQWIARQGEQQTLHVSSVVVTEIQRGAAKLRRAGGMERAARLEAWLEQMLTGFGDKVIPVDALVAHDAGNLEDAVIARGRNPGLADVLIASTARVHNLTVLTTNVRHFAELSVPFLDPFVVDPEVLRKL